MAGRGGKARKKSETGEQDSMAFLMDELLAFQDFRTTVLPKLQEMVKQGKSADEIFKFAEAMAAAKMVTHALTDTDSGRAITATKDILDRSVGKAKERHEHEHKYAKLTDAEIDALLASEEQNLSDVEDEKLQ